MSIIRSVLVTGAMSINPGAAAIFETGIGAVDRSSGTQFDSSNQMAYKKHDEEPEGDLLGEQLFHNNPNITAAQLCGSSLHKMHRGRN